MHLEDAEESGARAPGKMVAAVLGHPASEMGWGRSPSMTARRSSSVVSVARAGAGVRANELDRRRRCTEQGKNQQPFGIGDGDAGKDLAAAGRVGPIYWPPFTMTGD
jgi:hypothetical protein